MKITRMRVGAIATTCAIAGAGAGIAGSSAATNTSKSKSATAAKSGKQQRTATTGTKPARRGPGGHRMGRRGGPAVHVEAVVLNKAGTAYVTQKMDNGVVRSVAGDELTITEGTTAVPYKDVTVTIPSGAKIRRNGKTATLADLKTGDRVHVAASPDGTEVFAADDTFRPMGRDGRGGLGHGRGHGHDGPPPAGAPAPPAPPAP